MLKRWRSVLTNNFPSSTVTYSVVRRCMHFQEPRSHAVDLEPSEDFIINRMKLFDEIEAKQNEAKEIHDRLINITLPDGKIVPGYSMRTTPFEIAQGITRRLADDAIVARVNGTLWDLDRPFEGDSSVEILNYDSEEGKMVFWHSSAHVLGEAMEMYYKGLLCYGPPIEGGFYYDMSMCDKKVSSNDFSQLEAMVKQIVKEKQKFVRLELKKEELLKMFSYNPFKLRILNEKVCTPTTTVYRCGPLIDLCLGPHVRHTGKLKAFSLTKNSSTYWQGDKDKEQLQRIYGVSFPSEKKLKEWKYTQEEALKRDHRKIGKDQELFFFHELSPGSCFFLPNGTHVYNKLIDYIREEYEKHGYEEVITPNIYSTKLWEKSGHWQHYSDNMFSFDVENEKYALKPMNCPGHCLVFDTRPRSWRELPIRMADFGVLHRNELSGTLSGLTRVRRFQQDDAHIFCTMEQVEDEIKGCLNFLRNIYDMFGFTFKLCLATRPEKYMGSIDIWDSAEKQLEESLVSFNEPWELNEGDGAFYGPKIDVQICDVLNRYHQCATIQLDFQLPENFGLSYVSDSNGETKTPVMIHRAILGSVERMMAILIENYAGKWPFWLSPRQAVVIPVNSKYDEYANDVAKELSVNGFKVSTNLNAGETLNKKIRNAQLKHYNFVLVVGEKEFQSKSVNVRTRDKKVHGEKTLSALLARFRELGIKKDANSEEEF